jgi:hypothetical protein
LAPNQISRWTNSIVYVFNVNRFELVCMLLNCIVAQPAGVFGVSETFEFLQIFEGGGTREFEFSDEASGTIVRKCFSTGFAKRCENSTPLLTSHTLNSMSMIGRDLIPML